MAPGAHVSANLVLAANGATTIGGRSAPLSSGGDRARFHALRAEADLIVIGGRTARAEPYEKTPCELIVTSRGNDLGRASANPLARLSNLPITELLPILRRDGQRVLIEAGASLLSEAIHACEVDELFITRAARPGDGDYFSEELITNNFELVEEESSDEDRFQRWRLRPTH